MDGFLWTFGPGLPKFPWMAGFLWTFGPIWIAFFGTASNEFKKLNVYKWKYTTFDLFVAVSRVALSLTSSKKCFPAKAWVTRRKRRKGEIIFFRMTWCQFWSFESDGLVSESDRKGWRQLGSLQREALLRKFKNQLNSLPSTFLLHLDNE